MAVSAEFRDYVLELLEPLGRVQAKRMFGGVGLYLDGTIFAILTDETVFLKVDDQNRSAFEAEGMPPFNPFKDDKRLIKSYSECPPRLLEDSDALCDWARTSWQAGRRVSTKTKLGNAQ